MNTCEVCGDTPVCKTGLCPACTVDLWTGRTELHKRSPYIPHLSPDKKRLIYFKKPENRIQSHLTKCVNRYCPSFLGINVAEHVLSNVFKNVVRTPMGNKGFDFWCDNGFKIDVKSSCQLKNRHPAWAFNIHHNKIADYFLCIAFDNREDLNPLHLWLVPGNKANHRSKLSVSANTLSKLDKYKLDINKTITCCDAMKS